MSKSRLGNRTYDAMKFIAQIGLPAAGTAYAAVSGLWGWPNTEEIVGTIIAVDTFLGVLLGISSAKYNANEDNFDGNIHVVPAEGDGRYVLEINDHDAIAGKNSVNLKVQEH